MPEGPIQPYARPARLLHWTMAVLVLVVIPAGFLMMNLPSGPAQDTVFDFHRSLGVLIFTLALMRVAARLIWPPPGRPAGMPVWMWLGAETIHYVLYALLIVMPILGWLTSSAFGATVRVFGLFDLPNLLSKNEPLSQILGTTHQRLGYLMIALLVAHIGAGLWHGFVRRDGVLQRMLPSLDR